MNPRRMLSAADPRQDPFLLAREVYREGNDVELTYLLRFFKALVYHMADLEETQGGYRTNSELYLGHWCKTLKGHMMNMKDEGNAIY